MPDFEVELTELHQAAINLGKGGEVILSASFGAGKADIPDLPAPASVIPRADGKGHYAVPKLEAPDNAFGRELGFADIARAYDTYRMELEGQLRTLGDHTADLADALGKVAEMYRVADQGLSR
ncbi:hypothetical protein [Amycolatopsis sp. NPDC102389]|uniref:hypothetical protein n=1 Tax=Amycolatopsis sp. NPDC102389 TaxID=3363941 RepID=UPI0037FBF0A8